jgi:hypothetical protein
MEVFICHSSFVHLPRPRILARVIRQTHERVLHNYISEAAQPHDFEFYISLLQRLRDDEIVFIDFNFSTEMGKCSPAGFIDEQKTINVQPRLLSNMAHEQAHALLSLTASTQEQYHFSLDTFLDLIRFLEAFNAVCKAICDSVVTNFNELGQLRNRIKSLNLPKNLFPQSLRPAEPAAL